MGAEALFKRMCLIQEISNRKKEKRRRIFGRVLLNVLVSRRLKNFASKLAFEIILSNITAEFPWYEAYIMRDGDMFAKKHDITNFWVKLNDDDSEKYYYLMMK
jgi:hypothetical protein